MDLTELIKLLNEVYTEHGDLTVYIVDSANARLLEACDINITCSVSNLPTEDRSTYKLAFMT